MSAWPEALRRISGGQRDWPNAYGFGCETIGNFDAEDPTQSVAMKTSLDVLAEVHRLWEIPVEHCFFHRDVSFKSCPGERVEREWVHAELRKRLEGTMPEIDVDEWAAPSVERVKAAGIMLGKSEDYFGGRESITRQEVAVVADRLLQYIEEAAQ